MCKHAETNWPQFRKWSVSSSMKSWMKLRKDFFCDFLRTWTSFETFHALKASSKSSDVAAYLLCFEQVPTCFITWYSARTFIICRHVATHICKNKSEGERNRKTFYTRNKQLFGLKYGERIRRVILSEEKRKICGWSKAKKFENYNCKEINFLKFTEEN